MARVAILGCGPAGLLAAHAVKQAGHAPVIFSRERAPSRMPGAIFLHEPIPGLTDEQPEATVNFIKVGDRGGYAAKLYGSEEAPCSWDAFPSGAHDCWNLVSAYERLWDRFGLEVHVATISDDECLLEIIEDCDCVISTIPPSSYCINPEHQFYSKEVWIKESAPTFLFGMEQPVIVYNGERGTPYYRASVIFGEGSTEYPEHAANQDHGLKRGIKPLDTDCGCYPKVIRAGRFGRWRRGVLAHEAYHVAKGLADAL